MSHRSIPFSLSDRSTIRSTALWMALSGVILVVCGGLSLVRYVQVLAEIGALALQIFWMPVLVAAVQVVFGGLLLLGSRAFANVADTGHVAALNRGFSALTVIYVFQAIVLLTMAALFVLRFLLPTMG